MRIWFNRGYSLALIAKCMISADPDLEVIISVGEGKPQYEGTTYTFEEPELEPDAYIAWARRMISDHKVDLFIPTKHRKHFYGQDMGCRVHFPCRKHALHVIDNKSLFADTVKGTDYHLPTASADTVKGLETALEIFREVFPDGQPCVKPREGVNGHGFWKVMKKADPADLLLHPEYREIDQDTLLAVLALRERHAPIDALVIMDYLPGPEVSVDLLCHDGRVLKAVARTKFDRRQRVQSTHPLIEASRQYAEMFKLNGVTNVQYRKARDGSWKILEINARPAGGSMSAEDHGGGLISDWGALLTGRKTPDDISPIDVDIEIAITTTRVVTNHAGDQP